MKDGAPSVRKAFAAVEILAVTAVIAILLGLGFGVYRGARLEARVVLAESNLRQVGTALDLYFTRYGAYPPFRSDLKTALEPFVLNPDVFSNPLVPGEVSSQSLTSLYFPPTFSEGDSSKHYVTAFVSDDGQTAIVLSTGGGVERPGGLSFDPTNAGQIIHQITGETVISGIVNVDPRNNPQSLLTICLPNGQIITRNDLHSSRGQASYVGAADWVRFDPKGEGNQNGIHVNGVHYPLYNGLTYTISRLTQGRMRIRVWNEDPVEDTTKKKVKSSVDMGAWYVDIMTIGGQITSNKSGTW